MARSHASGLPWAGPILLLGALLLLAAGVVLLIRQWRRQLRASQRQSDWLQRVIDGAELALYFLDPQGCMVQWSLGAEHLYGYAASEVLGRHFSVLSGRDERASRVPQDTLETAARLGRHRSCTSQVRRDGTRAQVEWITQALRDGRGRLVGFSCAARDVSTVQQQRQALREAHSALAQAQRMAALGRLSGGIAHEFNNVTHVIRTCAEFLQRQGVAGTQSSELMQMIKRNADRAADLSQQLLSVARGPTASAAGTDVNEVVTSVAQLLRLTLSEDIGVELHLDETLSWCAIDRNELEAALLNVAADARDAMPDGGTVELTTHGEPAAHAQSSTHGEPGALERRCVLVSISHSRRSEASSATVTAPAELNPGGGSGRAAAAGSGEAGHELGITLIRSLIEESQGEVRIEPHPRGATVQLYLPCRAS
jgi:PAS domain S-box-containing protein